MRTSRIGAALLLAILLLSGCRSSAPRVVEVDGASGALRVVVAPMNLAVPLGPDLQDAVDPVVAELVAYLRDSGVRVAVIWGPDAIALWAGVETGLTQEGKPLPPVEQIASGFARAVAAESPYDVLLIPSLVYRDARVAGRVAIWDGVQRRIRFTLEPSKVAPQAVDAESRITQGPRKFEGKITGLSMHALVLSPRGELTFQGFGGLDLVHDIREGEGGKESVLRLQARPLDDHEHLREGIALALDPYLVTHAAAR